MDSFFKGLFNNAPVNFAEIPGPTQKDITETPTGASGSENQNPQSLQPEAAKTTLGEIIQKGQIQESTDGPGTGDVLKPFSKETKQKTKEAQSKTRDTQKDTADVTKQLLSKDKTGELKELVQDKIDNSESKREEKFDQIREKFNDKRDAAVDKAKDRIKQVDAKLSKAFEEFYKSLGKLAKEALKQFLKMATNVVNSMRAMLAGKIEGHYADKADKYAEKANTAQSEGKSHRAEMLASRANRAMETSREVRSRGNEYYYRAHGMREQANKLRAQRTGNTEPKQNQALAA